jgi:hypothetical protein
MGKRMDDAVDALRRGTTAPPRNSWGSIARGDQMFWTTLFRGRVFTVIWLCAAAALLVLLVVLFR